MDWNDLRRIREELSKEATKPLTKKEIELLGWLVEEERKYRFATRGGVRVPKPLREQLEAIVSDELPDTKEGDK